MSSSDSLYYNLLRIVAQAHYRGIRQVSLQAVLFGSLLTRKLALLTQCSNNAPEVACCHQRTLRNSKTLLYGIVTNTLTPPLHFAKWKYMHAFVCSQNSEIHFAETSIYIVFIVWCMLSAAPAGYHAANWVKRFVYFVNGARRHQVLSGVLFEHCVSRASLRKTRLIKDAERSI